MQIRNFITLWQKVYESFTSLRKNFIDKLFEQMSFPHPDLFTLSSLIVSILLFFTIISGNLSLLNGIFLLLSIVLLDALDGSAARKYNVNNPIKDIAADRISEALITSAIYFKNFPYADLLMILFLINIFLPIKFVPILPIRIILIAYILFLWKGKCIPYL